MLELFSHPEFLVAGAALISAPIIIHLINRMRFKRVRWAAMEFLLKSQKRNRRRLIIEQLLLLALRCLLVMLTALLVLRFTGLGSADFASQDGLHVIVLDDTLSMNDHWKEGKKVKTSFLVARDEVILDHIYNSVAQSTTNDRLVVLPLSRLVADADFEPAIYQRLGEPSTRRKLIAEVGQLKASKLGNRRTGLVDAKIPDAALLQGLKRAIALFHAKEHRDQRHVLHVVSDFRDVDWRGATAKPLFDKLKELKEYNTKIWLRDTAHPSRRRGGLKAHDNVGIVDFRANTRVVGTGMLAIFNARVKNYTTTKRSLNLKVINDKTGTEMNEAKFYTPMPFEVKANEEVTVTFAMRLFSDADANKFTAQRVSAQLETGTREPLTDDDGLLEDNLRHASVEIRDKVPVLIVDGKGGAGQAPNNDSFFIRHALNAVPGARYDLIYGHDLGGGNPARALERLDLAKFDTVFLLNVDSLTELQRTNLEEYVRQGGGVAFFLGPLVNAEKYTDELYRKGEGLFPAPLLPTYYPPDTQPLLTPKVTGEPQLLLRRDLLGPGEDYPIFGPIFNPDPKLEAYLMDVPIHRYFQVKRNPWKPEPGKVFELATLPNTKQALEYQENALKVANQIPVDNAAFNKYKSALIDHRDAIIKMVEPNSVAKAYELAGVLEDMLEDMPGFWRSKNSQVTKLKKAAKTLFEETQFGDPLVVARQFGKGRVVAVMTTAGKEWQKWAAGSGANEGGGQDFYEPFIWETQNWLSSQSGESNLLVGSSLDLERNTEHLKKLGIDQVVMVRSFIKPRQGEAFATVKEPPDVGVVKKKGFRNFPFRRTFEPGYYLAELFPRGAEANAPLATWNFDVNVDTANEGQLKRLSQQTFNEGLGLTHGEEGDFLLRAYDDPGPSLANRQTDLSQSAWLFLLFLVILVSEQALAVHLSFHLKASESQTAAQAPAPRARAA